MAKRKLYPHGALWFHRTTKPEVCKLFNQLFESKERIRLWYGDIKTGRSWNDENDVCGTVGRSTGEYKIPLLIQKRTSFGGGAILDSCIIKVVRISDRKVLYQHPEFNQPKFVFIVSDMPEYEASVYGDGQLYARCKKSGTAQRLAAFMNGERFSK